MMSETVQVKPEGSTAPVMDMRSETKGYVVAYDLRSGEVYELQPYETVIKDGQPIWVLKSGMTDEEIDRLEKAQAKIESVRSSCTQKIQKLGASSTQSVILCSARRKEEIEEVIDSVYRKYEDLGDELVSRGVPENVARRKPVIRKIPIIETQFLEFKSLAERTMMLKLEKKISQLGEKMEKLPAMKHEDRAKARENLEDDDRKLEKTKLMAKELGLDLGDKLTMYDAMLKKAMQTMGGI